MKSHITLQAGALAELDSHLSSLQNYSQLVLISHDHLLETYRNSFLSSLKRMNRPLIELTIPPGEKFKTLTQAKYCWKRMLACNVDRQAAVIAFGGGLLCDLAGFVASCYMRGIDCFYIPTTLLAMVDAAIGGKTAINFQNTKNAIGTFHNPKQVIIDPECLKTLPNREFNSGIGEIIKYGMIGDLSFAEKLEREMEGLKNRESQITEGIIKKCVEIKEEIVAQDGKDLLDKRALLNYGHTFGHAIEGETKYIRYLHGEAISIGMSCAGDISTRLGLCEPSVKLFQDDLCQRAELPIHLPRLRIQYLLRRMRSDKKATCGKINLILLERIGKAIKICNVEPLLIEGVLLSKMG